MADNDWPAHGGIRFASKSLFARVKSVAAARSGDLERAKILHEKLRER
jgi:hypothetical protein